MRNWEGLVFTACLASFKEPDAGAARWASRRSLGEQGSETSSLQPGTLRWQ
ncbi:hypothetical protein A2U01_0060133, partial [Trifolium medium]|nr:hypothetical protein [Trifolium medium]